MSTWDVSFRASLLLITGALASVQLHADDGPAAGTDPAVSQANAPTAEQVAFFEQHIRPVLVEHCYKCHSEKSKKVKGSLRLDYRDTLLHGGESGLAIAVGDPEKSLLIHGPALAWPAPRRATLALALSAPRFGVPRPVRCPGESDRRLPRRSGCDRRVGTARRQPMRR